MNLSKERPIALHRSFSNKQPYFTMLARIGTPTRMNSFINLSKLRGKSLVLRSKDDQRDKKSQQRIKQRSQTTTNLLLNYKQINEVKQKRKNLNLKASSVANLNKTVIRQDLTPSQTRFSNIAKQWEEFQQALNASACSDSVDGQRMINLQLNLQNASKSLNKELLIPEVQTCQPQRRINLIEIFKQEMEEQTAKRQCQNYSNISQKNETVYYSLIQNTSGKKIDIFQSSWIKDTDQNTQAQEQQDQESLDRQSQTRYYERVQMKPKLLTFTQESKESTHEIPKLQIQQQNKDIYIMDDNSIQKQEYNLVQLEDQDTVVSPQSTSQSKIQRSTSRIMPFVNKESFKRALQFQNKTPINKQKVDDSFPQKLIKDNPTQTTFMSAINRNKINPDIQIYQSSSNSALFTAKGLSNLIQGRLQHCIERNAINNKPNTQGSKQQNQKQSKRIGGNNRRLNKENDCDNNLSMAQKLNKIIERGRQRKL